ncbi:MAG: hypothetical protein ACO1OQ_07420 [Rufibacter sp.]
MKKLPWLYLLLLLAGACEQAIVKNYVVQVDLQPLTDQDMYHASMVEDAIFDAEELAPDSVRLQSRQLFLRGIDLYKNKQKPEEAVALFKASILLYPEAKTYYELGNALLASKNYVEAKQALEVAEHLQFQPQANVYFAKAVVFDRLRYMGLEKAERNYDLYQAFEAGFTDTALVLKDQSLRKEYLEEEFQEMLTRLRISKIRENAGDLYSLFLKSFQQVKQPFEIPVEQVNMKGYDKSISYDFQKYIPEMQNTSFGRDVSHDFFYVAKVAESPAYTALVYSSVSFQEEEMQPVLTKLVTYSPKGKVISSLLFSCQCSAEKVKKGRIENNTIILEDYKRVWKHAIDKVPFEKNQVVKYEPLATATFKINTTGEIVEESVPAQYKDSGILASQN